jgi:hypothetical protein
VSTLYLYAIADQPPDVTNIDGLGDEPFIFTALDVAVIGTKIEHEVTVSEEALRAQDRIVRELHARVPALLPMRFGSTVPNYGALKSLIEARGALLHEQLGVVRNRDQMTLRIFGAKDARAAKVTADEIELGAGTRYLAERRALVVPPELTPFLDALKTVIADSRIESGRHEGVVASVYHLIDRGSDSVYRAAVEKAGPLLPSAKIRVSGPSPTYAFTE